MEYFLPLGILIAFVTAATFWQVRQAQAHTEAERKRALLEEKIRQREELEQLEAVARDFFQRMKAARTTAARQGHAQKSLQALMQAQDYAQCRDVIRGYDVMRDELESVVAASQKASGQETCVQKTVAHL